MSSGATRLAAPYSWGSSYPSRHCKQRILNADTEGPPNERMHVLLTECNEVIEFLFHPIFIEVIFLSPFPSEIRTLEFSRTPLWPLSRNTATH